MKSKKERKMEKKEFLSSLKKGKQDFRNVNLAEIDLSGANLIGANLSNANLSNANLSNANLSKVNLSCVKLIKSNLSGADLTCARLTEANLSGANLSGAGLIGTYLFNTNFSEANLSKTVLDPMNTSNSDISKFELIDSGQWVVGYRSKRPIRTNPDFCYSVGDRITAPIFSTAETECHPGLYVEPTVDRAWFHSNEVVKVIFRPWDLHKAGGRYRVRELIVWADIE